MFRLFESIIDPFRQSSGAAMPKDSVVRFILFFAGQAPWVFLSVLVFGGAQAWIEIAIFSFIGDLVDLMNNGDPASFIEDNWFKLLWMVFFVGVIRMIIMLISTLLVEQTIVPSFFSMVRWQSHRNVIRQSLSFFQNDFAGRITTKVMQSGPAIGDFLIGLLDTVWLILLYAISTMALFAELDWRMTLLLAAWAALYAAMMFYYIPKVRENARRLSEAISGLNGRLVDSYSNMMLVKVDSDPVREDEFVAQGNRDFIKNIRRYTRVITTLRMLVKLNNTLMMVGIAYLCIVLWQGGEISVGVVAFVLGMVFRLNLLAGRFQGQVNSLFRNMGQAQDSMRTVAQDVTLKDAPDASELVFKHGEIRFENVRFKYNQSEGLPQVINDLSVTIKSGEKVGIVGPSGAGKSTLMNLLLRLYELDKGQILIDGQSISDVTQTSLRNVMGVVSQDTSLLHRSIRDNISFARPQANDEEIIACAQKAQADSFLFGLEDGHGRKGLDAYVGERGVKLSGGQRQRIAIARVLLKNAPILILDEATSALDSEVEAAIQSNLKGLMSDKTVIAIAHRLSTIAQMDRLIVMDDGRIVEIGNHEELISNGGLYAALWARQSGGFINNDATIEKVSSA